MDLSDIQNCADYYQSNYMETFYLVITYFGRSFILIGEKENFPHLMGIAKNTYNSNGYRSPKILYNDILERKLINPRIVPRGISTISKMYKKALNFCYSIDIFWNNKGPLAVNYNPILGKNLQVDVLITDIKSGYMLGWTKNKSVQVNAEISLEKYCISSWIDESAGSTSGKEKYLPSQDVELLRHVFAFDKHSKLIKQKEYKYSYNEKRDILKALERNNGNLLLDTHNKRHYINVAKSEGLKCEINGVVY
jgi:hypothetical protein